MHNCSRYLLVILLAAYGGLANAQQDTLKTRPRRVFSPDDFWHTNLIGIKAGPAFYTLYSKSPQLSYKTSFAVSISECYFFSNYIGIQAALAFERKGAKFISIDTDGNGSKTSADYALHIDYLTIPIHLVIGFGKKSRVNFLNGFFVGWPASASLVPVGLYKDKFPVEDVSNHYRLTDIGYTGGISADIKVYRRFFISPELYFSVGFQKYSIFHTAKKPGNIGFATLLALKYKV